MTQTTRFTAAEFRDESTFEVEFRPGRTLLFRRVSLAELLFTGYIPLPLAQAVESLEPISEDDSLTAEAQGAKLMARPAEERAALVDVARRWICVASVDPVFVLEDDGQPDHVPVRMLWKFEELMAIFRALKGQPLATDPNQVPAPLHGAAAADFRESDRGPAAAAVRAGEDVPPAPLGVDRPDVDLRHL